MPKHVLLTDAERNSLFAIPSDRDELARHYLLSQADMELIGKTRKPQNKFGVALQLSLLRHPGFTLAQVIEQFEKTPAQLMVFIAEQLFLSPSVLGNYASREQTMTDHALNIMDFLNLRPPIREDIPAMIAMAADAAYGTDKGCKIVDGLLGSIRQQKIALPNISTIERVAIAGRARARKQAYHAMSIGLSPEQLAVIDNIFDENPDQNMSYLSWLKAMPVAAKPDHIRDILARLQFVRSIEIDPAVAENVHINRYRQFVSEGRASASYMVERYISPRRRAIVIAFLIDVEARLTDAAIEMADKLIGSMFTRARNAQTRRYAATAKDVSRLMKLFRGTIDALSEAIEDEGDPYELIEAQVGWANLVRVREEVHQIAETSNEDPLLVAADRFATLRKFTPQLIEALEFKAGRASAKTVAALEVLKQINRSGKREIPVDAPMPFKKEWQKLIVGDDGKINRRLYETATFAHLRNKLRSGDVWVERSSAYRRFDSYLLAASDKATLEQAKIKGSADTWIREKAQELDWRIKRFAHRLKTKKLEGVVYADGKLQITPVKAAQSPQADALGDQINAMMPPIRITELLHEVARETGFLSAFTNLRTGEQCPNESALLAAILADATNLGISRMAAASQGITRDQLIWTQDAYVRDECYRMALANIIDSHHKLPVSQAWGTGTTSSSDGQFFRGAKRGASGGDINARYGNDPGFSFYTHVSDQHGPYHVKVISAATHEAPYVLDGLLHHGSILNISEHFTDTGGATDHVFALCSMLGFRFCPRLRDFQDRKLIPIEIPSRYPSISSLLGQRVKTEKIREHWDDIIRLVASIKTGHVAPSVMMRKLAAYERQNQLDVALQEIGKIERTLFMLDWLENPELRRRCQAGLNKSEQRHALTQAISTFRQGRIIDRSHEAQQYRASGLNLVIAAIVYWNTTYISDAVGHLQAAGVDCPMHLLAHTSPVGWEHIAFSGDFLWDQAAKSQDRRGLNIEQKAKLA